MTVEEYFATCGHQQIQRDYEDYCMRKGIPVSAEVLRILELTQEAPGLIEDLVQRRTSGEA